MYGPLTSAAFPVSIADSIALAMDVSASPGKLRILFRSLCIKARPVSISWWCVSEQMMSLPQSVLEDFNPKTAVVSKQAELHPPGNAGSIVVDRAGKAKRPSIVVAVPLHQPIDLPLF